MIVTSKIIDNTFKLPEEVYEKEYKQMLNYLKFNYGNNFSEDNLSDAFLAVYEDFYINMKYVPTDMKTLILYMAKNKALRTFDRGKKFIPLIPEFETAIGEDLSESKQDLLYQQVLDTAEKLNISRREIEDSLPNLNSSVVWYMTDLKIKEIISRLKKEISSQSKFVEKQIFDPRDKSVTRIRVSPNIIKINRKGKINYEVKLIGGKAKEEFLKNGINKHIKTVYTNTLEEAKLILENNRGARIKGTGIPPKTIEPFIAKGTTARGREYYETHIWFSNKGKDHYNLGRKHYSLRKRHNTIEEAREYLKLNNKI